MNDGKISPIEKTIDFSLDKTAKSSLKMNTFVLTKLPSCNVFETVKCADWYCSDKFE